MVLLCVLGSLEWLPNCEKWSLSSRQQATTIPGGPHLFYLPTASARRQNVTLGPLFGHGFAILCIGLCNPCRHCIGQGRLESGPGFFPAPSRNGEPQAGYASRVWRETASFVRIKPTAAQHTRTFHSVRDEEWHPLDNCSFRMILLGVQWLRLDCLDDGHSVMFNSLLKRHHSSLTQRSLCWEETADTGVLGKKQLNTTILLKPSCS